MGSSIEDEAGGSVVDFGRRGAGMGAVRPQVVVEPEERVELGVGVDQRDVVLQVDLVVFDRAPEALDEEVVDGPAAASIEMRIGRSLKMPSHSALVNWLPWSVLKISGLQYWLSARRRALAQKPASSVLKSSQARTLRLYQSRIATR